MSKADTKTQKKSEQQNLKDQAAAELEKSRATTAKMLADVQARVAEKKRLEREEEEAWLREQEIEKGFMPRIFTMATLPHSDPKAAQFVRKNGNQTLTLTALNPEIGLPYGKVPRLILAWITSEVLRTGERRIEVGGSLSQFLSKVGLKRRGGKRGDIKAFREQFAKLAATGIYINGQKEQGDVAIDFSQTLSILDEHLFGFRKNRKGRTADLPSIGYIKVSEKLFDQIMEASIPIDLRVLVKERSPLKIDIYTWLTYRLHTRKMSGRSALIPWNLLELQFGAEYGDRKDFRKKFKKAFNEIAASGYFKDLRYGFDNGKLIIYKGEPHIRARASKLKELPAPQPK